MLDGYVDFFMDPHLADLFCNLKKELEGLVQKKVMASMLMPLF